MNEIKIENWEQLTLDEAIVEIEKQNQENTMCINTIHLKKYYEALVNGTWVQTEDIEERDIGYDEFYKITSSDTISFFTGLGGTEKVYHNNGKIIKLISTSPDETNRVIYNFSY